MCATLFTGFVDMNIDELISLSRGQCSCIKFFRLVRTKKYYTLMGVKACLFFTSIKEYFNANKIPKSVLVPQTPLIGVQSSISVLKCAPIGGITLLYRCTI